jgi:transcriptional regulator with XRE-family HTH domain
MSNSATAAEKLRGNRIALGVSQSKLARLSGVSRFKICLYELGDGSLTADEQNHIRRALQTETDRLRNLPANVEFGETSPHIRQTGSEGESAR